MKKLGIAFLMLLMLIQLASADEVILAEERIWHEPESLEVSNDDILFLKAFDDNFNQDLTISPEKSFDEEIFELYVQPTILTIS